MLPHHGVWAAPSYDIHDVAMGYHVDLLGSDAATHEPRYALLGEVIDSNICSSLVPGLLPSITKSSTFICVQSFRNPWAFDTRATTHMTARFTNF
jgi:hypothetical protein